MSLRRFSRGVKRTIGLPVSSDSDDPDYEFNPATGMSQKIRARSPTRQEEERANLEYTQRREQEEARELASAMLAEQASLRSQASDFIHNYEVNNMITQINKNLGVNVDDQDPRIRFVIAQIVRVHGLSLKTIQLLRRSPILLNAIGNIIASGASRSVGYARTSAEYVRQAGDIIYSAGQEALSLLGAAAQVASRAISKAFSRAPSSQRQSRQRARSPGAIEVEGPPNLGFDEVRFSGVPVSAPPPAPEPEPVPPPAPLPPPPPPPEEDIQCSICMEDALPWQGAVLTKCGHRFHKRCIQPWINRSGTCPMCRNANPMPLTPAPPKRQGGGSSRKTRSKSKSKTRRLSKLRKSRKLKRRSYSSRRK